MRAVRVGRGGVCEGLCAKIVVVKLLSGKKKKTAHLCLSPAQGTVSCGGGGVGGGVGGV